MDIRLIVVIILQYIQVSNYVLQLELIYVVYTSI